MSSDDLMSVKELAAKLKVTDALVKKLIKDFGIETQRVQKRIHLDNSSSTTIREILALKASGKKNKEIKELFDAAKKATATEEPEADTQVETKTEKTETEEIKTETKTPKKPRKKRKVKKEETETTAEGKETTKEATEENKDSNQRPNKPKDDGVEITSYLDETEEDEISMAMRLAHDNNDDDEDEAEAAELNEEDLNLDDDEDEDEPEEKVVNDQRLSPKKTRRRQFSFRYIQRQIANDAKRIQYIKQKLKRGRLSTQEKMDLEESLEQRSKLHSGWVHLLRWVKS